MSIYLYLKPWATCCQGDKAFLDDDDDDDDDEDDDDDVIKGVQNIIPKL